MGIKIDKKSDKKASKPSKADKKAHKVIAGNKPVSAKEILPKASNAKAAVKPPPKPETSDSSDEDEDEKPVHKVINKAKKASSSSSDGSEDESDDEKPKVVQVKAIGKAPSPSDSDDSESSSEDEAPPKAAVMAQKKASKPAAKKAASPSSEASSDDDSEDEKVVTTIKKPTISAKKASSSEESDEDNDSSSEGEPVKAKDAKASESSSSESDVEMEAPPVNANKGKRKAEEDVPASPKKVKIANGAAATTTEPTEETKSIFVGSLDWSIDNERLAQEFAECGEVVSATVQIDRDSGRSRGFGYVHFATTQAVEAALLMNGKEIEGRPVNIDKSLPRNPNAAREKRAKTFGDAQSLPSAVLFVGNLSFNVGEDQLWEKFGEHGEVKSIRVPTDRDSGRPKGFAYVEFNDMESSKKAHDALQGGEMDGRTLRLDFSQPRDNSGDRGGFGGGRGGGRGGRGGGRGGFGDRGGRGGGRGGRGGFGDRGGRGGRGGPRGGRGGARTGGIANFEGKKTTF